MTAWESMTLPSRLRSVVVTRETLDQLENTLNVNGNQNIAKLQLNVPAEHLFNGVTNGVEKDVPTDARLRINGHAEHSQDNGEDDLLAYDIDLFSMDTGAQTSRRRSAKQTHIFGQAHNSRAATFDDHPGHDRSTDLGQERARRRAAGLKISRRYFAISPGTYHASAVGFRTTRKCLRE